MKRYVEEPGSDAVDRVFRDAYRGVGVLSFSYWNLAEAAVVFDRYSRTLRLDPRRLVRDMLRESVTLSRLRRLLIVSVSPAILRSSIELVLRYHIYAADALQVASTRSVGSSTLVTGDRELAKVAEAEGLRALYVGG